jgi:hypothetical protein
MAAYAPVVYSTPATLLAALALIETTVTVQVVPFSEDGRQKFLLIK